MQNKTNNSSDKHKIEQKSRKNSKTTTSYMASNTVVVALSLMVTCSLFLSSECNSLLVDGGVWPDPKSPPVWPSRFEVQFHELLVFGLSGKVKNKGTWYYNYHHLTAR